MDTNNPEKFQNKYRIASNRLRGWNYAQNGAYYITIVTHNREHLFGEIVDGKMILNEIGEIVHAEFLKSFEIRDELYLGEYVIMPNHIHAIVILDNDTHVDMANLNIVIVETHGRASLQSQTQTQSQPTQPYREPKSISSFLSGFKSSSINRVDDWIDSVIAADMNDRACPKKFNKQNPMWQANYYDHIIRNDLEYRQIAEYIINNPLNWSTDLHARNVEMNDHYIDMHGHNDANTNVNANVETHGRASLQTEQMNMNNKNWWEI